MTREHLYEPYSVSFETLDTFPKREHRHTFFELVHIIEGTGRQCINKHTFDYIAGHMFLLTPQDCHMFEIETTTRFFFLRFNNIYIRSENLQTESIRHLEYILQNASHEPGCILRNQTDKTLVKPVVDALLRETSGRDLFDKEITRQLVNTLIVVVARNIAKYLPQHIDMASDKKIVNILNYLQQHIYQPEMLRAENVSKHFGLSEHYLGKFFKKHVGQTLQSYINTCRISLIEHRLKHSDKRMNEIVSELGFTDESHLNKFFRSHKGISPKAYRDSFKNAA
ncbi:AraC family transcriptional regulator [Mucilaginibacter limnophilus]|uniref:AraC family transcriptional regulator n=1 Tax=Mucilaginibacter limnophilus TaxID=1932778 RepID=A0A3S2UKE9_9SPHI|nr:AraC family transcriptional regulator [Mucilaginibacter limnophilus]RVU00323.1 AraC family transcriptional regulator [Mucilaginibacter limnophilus]